jgi:hypothetical protein
MNKQIIVDKTVHGGILVETHFLILGDNSQIPLPYEEWRLYQIGESYPKEDYTKDSINWKEMHDLQQKLVISYTLENSQLKEKIKTLELKLRVQELTNFLVSKRLKDKAPLQLP